VTACIRPLPNSGVVRVGENITFDGGCSTPTAGLTYAWELGDGRTGQGVTFTTSYPTSALYTVALTVSSGGSSNRTTTTARIHIDCVQGGSNPTSPVELSANRLCIHSRDVARLGVASRNPVTFEASDFRFENVNGPGSFSIQSNECPGFRAGAGLFPGDLCNIDLTAVCTSGTTARFRILNSYAVVLTCNPF
jgi:hypothetical protein